MYNQLLYKNCIVVFTIDNKMDSKIKFKYLN